MEKLVEIAANISTPIRLGGLFAAIFFLIAKQLIKSDLFSRLSKQHSSDIIKIIIDRLFILSLVAMVLGFAGYSNKKPYPQLSNTTWHYMDTDWEYDMEFLSNGVLRTQHPNDKTPNNDKWLQNGNNVSFSFNNGYSTYEGKFSGNDIISGTAESKTGVIWNWKAIRVKR